MVKLDGFSLLYKNHLVNILPFIDKKKKCIVFYLTVPLAIGVVEVGIQVCRLRTCLVPVFEKCF